MAETGTNIDMNAWLQGKRALVMGLGVLQGGVGVARYLVGTGAEVTVTDLRPAAELRSALDALEGLPIRYRLGEHRPEDFESTDLVVRNPGVPAESPWLQRARQAGARIEMEMSLFFRACPAPIIGITGTRGKTTTSTLCAGILRQAHPDTVLAGNMGESALGALERIGPRTPVVIELSSFQLEGLGEHQLSPHIAVWTNVSQDHLNRYPSFDAYVEAKRHVARFQQAGDWFVANRDDPLVWQSRDLGSGSAVPFGRALPGGHDADGAFLDGERLVWRWGGEEQEICTRHELSLPGEHAVWNALAASAAALLAGATAAQARAGLTSAAPVPDRQEFIATIDGVDYINDTSATSPAAVLAALETFRGRKIVLIAGGSDKGLDLRPMAQRIAAEAWAVVLLDGTATPNLRQMLAEAGLGRISGAHASMEEAVRAATALMPEECGVVLLSPGCASFGLFTNEFDRGRAFRAAVRKIATEQGREVGA